MKYFLFLLCVTLLMAACGGKGEKIETAEAEIETTESTDSFDDDFKIDTLRGSYMGDFGNGPIRIALNFVTDAHAVGYDLHRGIQRNISGKVDVQKDVVKMELAEPGDHPYDGVFSLEINKADFSVKGIWVANDKKLGKKTFYMKKQIFPKDMPNFDEVDPANITTESFTYYFYSVSDSLGRFTFQDNGLCTYTYNPTENENYVDQEESIKGDWKFNKGKLYITWEENNLFEESVTTMVWKKNDDCYLCLRYGNRVLYNDQPF